MSLCINPSCLKAQTGVHQAQSLYCSGCGSPLLILDIYRVLEKLGTGGFGTTYLISDAGSKYVLKVLHNTTPKAIELFQQEAEVLKKLAHPGIPQVKHPSPFTYRPQGSSDPLHCLIMDYIEGQNLYDYLKKRNFQPISEPAALRWLRQLVEILQVVHRANYFHRDIKPENIMLDTDGKLVLIDFGTAREETLTYLCKQQGKPGTSINSVGYTPYEQQQGRAESRSDFFALGRTFVFLLTGKNPGEFEDSITKGLQWQHSASGYAKPLRDFLDELMQLDVTKRPANTAVILSSIQRLEKQLQPQYYSPPILAIPGWMSPQRVMVKTWEITDKLISTTASMVAYSCGYILGLMTWAVRSVFSLVSVGIIGIIELISTLFSLIFGGIAYLFEAVWSGLQAFGEALGDFYRSFPWKVFAWSLIYFAFMGYLISPWNQEFIIFGGIMLILYLIDLPLKIINWLVEEILGASFLWKLMYVMYLGLWIFWVFSVYIGLIGVFFETTQHIVQIIFNFNLSQQINTVNSWQDLGLIAVGFAWILACVLSSGFLAIYNGEIRVKFELENTPMFSFKNSVLRSITASVGLGIGWMIYQYFPIVESPTPLLELLKDFLKN